MKGSDMPGKTQVGVDRYVLQELDRLAEQVETRLNADVMCMEGPLLYGMDQMVREALDARSEKRQSLAILLGTDGGVVEVVERIVVVLRKHYEELHYIVTDRAMSAGTVLAMSGDRISMDYFACLGPIDPQVQRDNRLVPALSYLVQFNRLIEKSMNGHLSEAELALLQTLDLAELHSFEEARELSVALLEEWLASYKFKNWHKTETRKTPVTQDMRVTRAREIAELLANNQEWHSHGRPLTMDVLVSKVNLRIEDLGDDPDLASEVRAYMGFLSDYLGKNAKGYVVHTRGFFD